MYFMATEAQKRATDKYLKEKMDEIKVRVPKGKKQEIKDFAELKGKSLNGYINRLIDEDMNNNTL